MDWVVKDNILTFQVSQDEYFVPNMVTIFEALDKGYFLYNNIQYSLPTGIRFSKIGSNSFLKVYIDSGDIKLSMYVSKGSESIKIPFINGKFVDSCVIKNSWHYLNNNYLVYSEILNKIEVKENNIITYTDYINLKRELEEKKIYFEDEVISSLKELKLENKSFLPILLKGKLYDYQRIGSNWLTFMATSGCGALLADEMGLGKTLQIIAMFAYLFENNLANHFLVVAPVSLLENWKREFKKFYPNFKTVIHHGTKRTGLYKVLLDYDVVITSYTLVQSDLSMFNMIDWDCVVLDEAQNIKNPETKRTLAIKEINRKVGVAVTGTPFENHITDLWSLIDFILPNYLGSLSIFKSNFDDSIESAARIEQIITPFMIRRKVNDVAKDLPERIDIPHPILMTEEEAAYYDEKRKNIKKKNSLMSLSLDVIQDLRKFCTHPFIYNEGLTGDPAHFSNKYQLLCNILEEIILNNEKVLIFTSYTNMIKLMLNDFKKRFMVYVDFINGSVNATDRQKIVDNFSNIEGSAILILNPKAAGVGLNITAANHVIHYNLEWNPALEDQASARAYRRGQDKTVFIHRLYYAKTIEEFMNDKLYSKRELSEAAIIGNKGHIDKQELLEALDISPKEM